MEKEFFVNFSHDETGAHGASERVIVKESKE